MKKFKFFAILFFSFFIISNIQNIEARPKFIPMDAYWRIDINPGHPGCTMDWYEVSYYGDWGQGQCALPGSNCHCYDWVTWWYEGIWVPDPPNGWISIYGQEYFPIYNPITGQYE